MKEKTDACAQRRAQQTKSTTVEAFRNFRKQTEEAESRMK